MYDILDQRIWQREFKLCGGKLQSPVSISSSTSKSIPIPLPALETIGYHDFLPTPLYLKNSGHSGTIKVIYLIFTTETMDHSWIHCFSSYKCTRSSKKKAALYIRWLARSRLRIRDGPLTFPLGSEK